MILHEIKAHLMQAKGSWVDDLYNVLWAYQTVPHILIGESPFQLAFEIKAMIPLDIGLSSLLMEQHNLMQNEATLRANLNLLDEVREQASIQMASYRQRMA